jgi:hypothetical protein
VKYAGSILSKTNKKLLFRRKKKKWRRKTKKKNERRGKEEKITLTMMKMIMTRVEEGEGVMGGLYEGWKDIVNLLSSVFRFND